MYCEGDGFEYWLDWLDDRYSGKLLDTSLLVQSSQIPELVRAQGVASINAYLHNLKQRAANASRNRVRVIFIGYGDAGKTSLVRVLHDEPVAETEPMTAGVNIREWPVPGTDIKAHFWDFGGPVMAHATHQLFLRESCLYVLVISSRSEIVDQTVWQHGVLLSHPHSETHALLEVDYHLRILSIWVNGQNARDYLTLIRDEIHTILARLDIDYEALLTLAASARIGPPARRASAAETAPYQQILAFDQ